MWNCLRGTLAKSVAQGLRVAIVDLTRGELGTRGTAETRKAEAAAAQGILGVERRENFDLGDGFFEVNEETLRTVIEVLRRLRPLRVIANALSDATGSRPRLLIHRAAFLSGLPKIDTGQKACGPRLSTTAFRTLVEPGFCGHRRVCGSEGAGHRRLCHAISLAGCTRSRLPNQFSRILEHLKARDVAMGRFAGVKLGEGFQVKRPPAVEGLCVGVISVHSATTRTTVPALNSGSSRSCPCGFHRAGFRNPFPSQH